jgi:hypothetical protein
MKAPPRLIDDPSVAPELRADLERTAATKYEYDVAAGLAGLHVAIGSAGGGLPPTDAGAGGQAAAQGAAAAKGSLLGATSVKVALVSVATAVTVAIVALPKLGTEPRRAPTAAEQRKAAPAVSAQPAAESPLAPEAPIAAQEPGAAVTPKPAIPQAPHLRKATDPDRALRREIELVGEMKAVLEADPGRAYALSQEANREIGRGMLFEEREALATLALHGLGKTEQAALRARAFLIRYPKSSLRERLEPIAQGR